MCGEKIFERYLISETYQIRQQKGQCFLINLEIYVKGKSVGGGNVRKRSGLLSKCIDSFQERWNSTDKNSDQLCGLSRANFGWTHLYEVFLHIRKTFIEHFFSFNLFLRCTWIVPSKTCVQSFLRILFKSESRLYA